MKAICVKVEDSTFAVPKHILDYPGTPFETMFTLQQPHGDEGDETTMEQDPVLLEGIPVDDFETFVHASHSESDNKLAPKLAVDSYGYWMGVLKLATMWNFNQVRKKAVDQMGSFIQSKTSLEMVYLDRKHFVPAWVKAGYVALCSQKDIKPDELASPPCGSSELALDWKTIAMLCFVSGHLPRNVYHEEIECRSCGTGAPLDDFEGVCLECSHEMMLESCRVWSVDTYEDLVSEHFKEELEELGAASDL
ncbi:hypothetical protein CPC08DRAFT_754557 [Agrocybe pediades]|nr:hypothetical protein CPC08DRAFT_754557 [Agrocybe pediades]